MSSKKMIAMPAGRWARELLTLAGADRIEYFLDDDTEMQKNGFVTGSSVKPVFSPEHILSENRDEIIVVITDTKRYAECRDRLTNLSLEENVHFFDGWHLDINFYRMIGDGFRTWADYEKSLGTFDYSEFSARAGRMARMIPDSVQSVMDLGCGDEVLRKYLDPKIKYYGLDIVSRNRDTIVCDLNRQMLPDIQVDAYYMAGFLLYINDVDKLISQMRGAKYLIFDLWNYAEYRRYDNIYMNYQTRKAKSVGWNTRDHFLSLPELIRILFKNGFVIENAMEMNRTGSYCCYTARNLTGGGEPVILPPVE